MFKEIFKHNEIEDSILRPVGAGFSVLYPLLIGLWLHDWQIAQFGVLGSFSFLAFQRISVSYNFKAILLHGIALTASFILGMACAKALWVFPFVIAIVSFVGFMSVKVFQIPKPAHFFVLMLLSSATNTQMITENVGHVTLCLLVGVVASIVNGLAVSFLENLPLMHEKDRYQALHLKDKFYVTIYKKPKIILDALHFSFILFVAGYVSYLMRENFGYWVLISCAAVLAGEEIEVIKRRYIGRIIGSVIGLLIGFILISLNLPTLVIILMLMLLNTCIEYFVPRNYAIANFFTNPLVLLLTSLTSTPQAGALISDRFIGVVLGSFIAFVLVSSMHKALRINNMEY